jgi:integrase
MAKRRANGDGALFQREDGRWVGRAKIAGKVRYFYGRKQSEAKKKLDKALEDARKGIYVHPTKLKFGEWLDNWLTTYKTQDIARSTLDLYEGWIENHIKPKLGHYTLTQLSADPDIIQKFYADRLNTKPLNGRGDKLSKRSVEQMHIIINSSLDQAVKSGKIFRNPDTLTNPPHHDKKEATYMPAEQFNQFLKKIVGDRWYTAFVVDFASGLRLGELVALKWDCFVVMPNKSGKPTYFLNIKETIVRVKNRNQQPNTAIKTPKTVKIKKPPKSQKSIREIPLEPAVGELLQQWKDRQDKEKEIACDRYNGQGYIFAWEDGRPVESGTLSKHFKKLIRDNGFPEEITFHKLRHSYASALIENGESLKTVQELLGHATIGTTGDIYTHVSRKAKQKAAVTIGRLIKIDTNFDTNGDNKVQN